jgi:hypothetical protein
MTLLEPQFEVQDQVGQWFWVEKLRRLVGDLSSVVGWCQVHGGRRSHAGCLISFEWISVKPFRAN